MYFFCDGLACKTIDVCDLLLMVKKYGISIKVEMYLVDGSKTERKINALLKMLICICYACKNIIGNFIFLEITFIEMQWEKKCMNDYQGMFYRNSADSV